MMDTKEKTIDQYRLSLTEIEQEKLKYMKEMARRGERLMSYYRCAMMEIETKFRVLNEQFAFQRERNPIDSIKTRLKSYDSIFEKLERLNAPFDISSIEGYLNDVAGVRVICAFEDDIYLLADCLMSQDDVTLISKKDYIKNPKPNGYRSLHLIVEIPIFLCDEKKSIKVEVQLRTIAMESWANLEHRIFYKKDISEEKREVVSKKLKECADMSARLDYEMREIRDYIEIKSEL